MSESKGWLSFEGRARRSEYWGKTIVLWLLTFLVAFPLICCPIFMSVDSSGMSGGGVLCIVAGVLLALWCAIAMLPITARRLHDRDMSGWWILWFALLNMVPYLGWIAGIAQFVVIGCLDGTPGPNRFGPDPKGRTH